MFSRKGSAAIAALLFLPVLAAPQLPTNIPFVNDLKVPASKFKFYELDRPMSGPCDLVPGPDGAIWIQNDLTATISRFDQKTGKFQTIDIPYTNPPKDTSTLPNILGITPLACAIQPGKDGKIYASAGTRNQFVVVDPKTMKASVFNPNPRNPLGNLQPFNDLYRADHGMFYSQTTSNVISWFDYHTHRQTTYKIPTPNSTPLGVYVTPDKAVWFTEFIVGNKMGRLNATTGKFKEYPLPPSAASPGVIRAFNEPYLYWTAVTGNSIGAINIHNGQIKSFPSPELLVTPTVDIGDKYGNVWYSSITQNLLGRLNPKTGKTDIIHTPFGKSGTPALPITDLSVTYDPKTNSIFFTSTFNNKLGRLQLPI